MNTTTPVLVEDVEAFCNFCVSMRSSFKHFQILFEGTELQRELMQGIAPTFFSDIHLMMKQDLILQICKITDREETIGNKNLTIDFLTNNSDFTSDPNDFERLKLLGKNILNFRKKLVLARNKIIGHLDRQAVLDDKPLGAALKGEWDQFWLDLQDYLQILHKRYVDPAGHFYLNGIAYLSDAENLIRALKESSYFQVLLKENDLTKKCVDVAFNSKFSKV